MPRKHVLLSQTQSKQQNQARIWQRLAKEIKTAVKVGGINIDANPRLKSAIAAALRNNLSRESIEKNINNSNKDNTNFLNIEFECYGPNGIQIIVSALTDNINRTTSNLRGYLTKFNAEISKKNSVMIFFEKIGYIVIKHQNVISIDYLFELTIEYDIRDIYNDGEYIIIEVLPSNFYVVENLLNKNNIIISESEIKLFPLNIINNIPEEIEKKLERFIEMCNNDDDIQNVVTNYIKEK